MAKKRERERERVRGERCGILFQELTRKFENSLNVQEDVFNHFWGHGSSVRVIDEERVQVHANGHTERPHVALLGIEDLCEIIISFFLFCWGFFFKSYFFLFFLLVPL